TRDAVVARVCAREGRLDATHQRYRSRKDPHRTGPRRPLRVAEHGIADATPGGRVVCGTGAVHRFTHRPYRRAVQQRDGPRTVDLPGCRQARAHTGTGFPEDDRRGPGGKGRPPVAVYKDRRRLQVSISPLAESAASDAEDCALVVRAKGGNRDALEDIVRRHQAWIHNIALRMLYHPRMPRTPRKRSSSRR